MKVKVLRNIGRKSAFPPYAENEVVDVHDDVGQKLIEAKLAEVYTPEPAAVLKPSLKRAD